MAILALDMATVLGWAVAYGPDDIASGVMEFRQGRHEGGGMRWLRFKKWLMEMRETCGPIEAIYYEEVRAHTATDAAHIYGGFLSAVTAFGEQYSIPYKGIPVGTIKRATTGSGAACKTAMVAAIRARGFAPADDNEADALAILLLSDDRQPRRGITEAVRAAVAQATAADKARKQARRARKLNGAAAHAQ